MISSTPLLTRVLSRVRLRTGAALAAALAFTLAACSSPPLAPSANVTEPTIAPAALASAPPALGPGLLALTQAQGHARLISSLDNQSYWPLSEYFETQKNEAYCSVASSVIALNALGIARPVTPAYPGYPFFTQDDFFRTVDPSVANPAQVSREGMTLDQLSAVLGHFPVVVQKYRASDLTLAQFRNLVLENTRHSDRFILLNFSRAQIGEIGGGHWSPLAAFDRGSDSALLLDVARYKYPAVWVPLDKLYQGALAVDSVSHLSRGLIIVSRAR